MIPSDLRLGSVIAAALLLPVLVCPAQEKTKAEEAAGLDRFLDDVAPVPRAPRLAYSVCSASDFRHLQELADGMKNTACDLFFVCPMYTLEEWNGNTFVPSGGSLLRPAHAAEAIRRLKSAGYTVAVQPIWTLREKGNEKMLPTVGWWPMWAHTDRRTVQSWRQVLWHWVEVSGDCDADYLVLMHEATNLLPYVGWKDFVRRARKRAPKLKFIFSQHGFESLRLYYNDVITLGIETVALTRTKGDRNTAAAVTVETVLQNSIMPEFRMPKDPTRLAQIGNDMWARGWVGCQTPADKRNCRYPFVDFIREDVDALKSSDYWPQAMLPDEQEEMLKAYRNVPFKSGGELKLPPVNVDFYAAQQHTRRLFGRGKPWFRETGIIDSHWHKVLKGKYAPFLQATVRAWSGHTDYVVWWPGGFEPEAIKAFAAATQTIREFDEERK